MMRGADEISAQVSKIRCPAARTPLSAGGRGVQGGAGRSGVLVAAAGKDAGEGEEDVEAIEVDGERELYGGGAVAALVDAHEVDHNEDAEDHEGQIRVDVGADEVKERAEESYDDQ